MVEIACKATVWRVQCSVIMLYFSIKKINPHTFDILCFLIIKKAIIMTAICKEDNNLNYQEIKCVKSSQVELYLTVKL